MEQDNTTFRDKGTEVPSLSQDKGTTGQAGKTWNGPGWVFDIFPGDGPGWDFDSKSRPILEYPGTASGKTGKKSNRFTIFEKKWTYFDFF